MTQPRTMATADAMDELRILEKLLDPDEPLSRETRDHLRMMLRRLLNQVAAGIAELEGLVKAARKEA